MIYQNGAEIASVGKLGVGLMTGEIMKRYLPNTTLALTMKTTRGLQLCASQHIYMTINKWPAEVRGHNE